MMNRTIILTFILMLLVSQTIFAQLPAKLAINEIKSPNFPNPILKFVEKEIDQKNGGEIFYRYKLRVTNFQAYPNSLFTPAPQLPPCGQNPNSSRTWVDVFDAGTNKRLYGFCAFNSPDDLNNLWFPLMPGSEPPDCLYLVMTDRKLNKTYKSKKMCIPSGNPAGKADLKVRQFLFPPTSTKALRVQIANYGNAASAACVLRLTVRKIDGTPVGRTTEIQVPALAAGKTDWVLIEVNRILPKNISLHNTTFKLNIDATKVVSESDESNNEAWHNL